MKRNKIAVVELSQDESGVDSITDYIKYLMDNVPNSAIEYDLNTQERIIRKFVGWLILEKEGMKS